jgi:hypothetical protein
MPGDALPERVAMRVFQYHGGPDQWSDRKLPSGDER